jgi:hypothetical protein
MWPQANANRSATSELMDVRHPTHELIRAAAALRARRTAMARKAPWPVSIDGLAALRGVGGIASEASVSSKAKSLDPDDEEAYPAFANDADPWKAHLAEIHALLDRTSLVLAGEIPLPKRRSHLVYDPDQDEAEKGPVAGCGQAHQPLACCRSGDSRLECVA